VCIVSATGFFSRFQSPYAGLFFLLTPEIFPPDKYGVALTRERFVSALGVSSKQVERTKDPNHIFNGFERDEHYSEHS
ncbi:hypothetical protein, partial [Escherichia coli]|uniref:hypothetical protein n=2 Tax=Enterobacteriaceae TaxID=543 RepID=UPI001BDD487C